MPSARRALTRIVSVHARPVQNKVFWTTTEPARAAPAASSPTLPAGAARTATKLRRTVHAASTIRQISVSAALTANKNTVVAVETARNQTVGNVVKLAFYQQMIVTAVNLVRA